MNRTSWVSRQEYKPDAKLQSTPENSLRDYPCWHRTLPSKARSIRWSLIARRLSLAALVMIAGSEVFVPSLQAAGASPQETPQAAPSSSPAAASSSSKAVVNAEHVQPGQSGAATRGAFAPVLDSEKRPITKGGFVKGGPIIFMDIAQKAGLTSLAPYDGFSAKELHH